MRRHSPWATTARPATANRMPIHWATSGVWRSSGAYMPPLSPGWQPTGARYVRGYVPGGRCGGISP
ncbi:hypothetical protein ACFFX0_23230 [Citricoccus parietis]|uniref:Uncharacterized protein n=1 Tax=Citricoccus parietis TaxID=592307 RepID=A0ABV5G4U3_9MICC